jgi:rhombotail lipoprotein
MKRTFKISSLVIVSLVVTSFLSSCATNRFDRGVSSNLVSYLYPKGKPLSHKDDQLPVLRLPLRVGIAFPLVKQKNKNYWLVSLHNLALISRLRASK